MLVHFCVLGGTGESSWVGCRWRMTQDQAGLRVHGTKTTWFASETKIREDRTVTVRMLADVLLINKSTYHQILREDFGKRISRLFKRLRRWSSQTFRKLLSGPA